MEFSADGKSLKTVKYQKKIWSSNDIFLNVSIYTVANPEAKGFDDNLKIPKKNPSNVANKIPIADTKIVFKSPTRYALAYDMLESNSIILNWISNDALFFKNPNPVSIPLADKFELALNEKYPIIENIKTKSSAWGKINFTLGWSLRYWSIFSILFCKKDIYELKIKKRARKSSPFFKLYNYLTGGTYRIPPLVHKLFGPLSGKIPVSAIFFL